MGKRSWMAGAIASFVLLVGAPQAWAVTPTTCGTLQADINAATDGEALQLPAGTCTTNLTITNTAAFTLEGATGGGTVLEPAVTTSPIVLAPDPGPVTFTLSGLTFTGAIGHAAILLQDPGEAVTITDDTFENNSYSGSGGAAVSIQTQFGAGTLTTQPTVISDDTFTGNTAGGGGAIALLGSNPITVSGSTFTGNTAGGEGGALDVFGAVTASTNAIQITGNTFGGSSSSAGNSAAGDGGAVTLFPGQGQPVTIGGNSFDNNAITGTATFDRKGAGLYINGQDDTTGAITQSHNTFSGNVINATAGNPNLLASGAGEFLLGAIVHSTADSFIDNRVASNDSLPPEGGAVGAFASGSPVEPAGFIAADDLFKSNSTAAGGWGGAIYTGVPVSVCSTNCPPTTLTLNDSTVVNNSVDAGSGSEGGAIWGSADDSLTVQNSIVYGNTPQPEIFGFGSNPPTVTYSDVCGQSGAGDICADPKLDSSGAETALSPTLDAGSNGLVPSGLATDLAGNQRVRANHLTCSGPGPAVVDMGAFEFTGTAPPPSCPGPRVVIGHGPLKDRHGTVRVKVACTAGQSYCDGTLVLKLIKHKHTLILGKAHFHIAVGHHTRVKVKLRRKALHKLGNAKSVRIRVAVTDHDAAGMRGSAAVKVKLLLP